ncbi:MAG TPA: ABC transporter permease [Candidatus Binataceae bacterium]|jgi:ABC-type multidrug transport system permease subunit|nr:ABC transporter permease [Candidatus Binataceae bacterium]
MLRTAWIVFQNEFRLLAHDRAAVFMLFLGPLVIITVAGLSLANIYGARPGSEPYSIIVVDSDHGWLARAIVDALRSDHSVSVVQVANLDDARTLVRGRPRAPLCIVIPSETTAAFQAGRDVHLTLYIDPVKRLEAGAIELDLDRLCREVTTRAHDLARKQMAQQASHLRDQLARSSGQMKAAAAQLDHLRKQFERARATAQSEMTERARQAIDRIRAETSSEVSRALAQTRTDVEHNLAARHDALVAVSRYLEQLQASQRDFETWLAKLKVAAGSYAGQIPAPPQWPTPPSQAQLAELSKPLDFNPPRVDAASSAALPNIAIRFPPLPVLPDLRSIPDPAYPVSQTAPQLPGILGWRERSITGGDARVNTFDQYVPGFGITFLLVDMLWGVGVGLIDERDWGTLARLRVSGASASGMMIGKLMARFLIGLGQMILLFGAGWVLFGISLGRNSWALLFPAAAISLAAAAFSLVIACVANTRDAVLPIGAMAALAMSAIGGCWWPLDFEPYWMRAVALVLPTTWTMEAFNNLMIRGLGPSSVALPTAVTFAIGMVFLAVGILSSSRIYLQAGQ